MSASIIEPQVAGLFYPQDPTELANNIAQLLSEPAGQTTPRAIIAPHAGLMYSGEIAGKAYACLKNNTSIKRVILFAPAHRFPFSGIATIDAPAFKTPLGKMMIDKLGVANALEIEDVSLLDLAFLNEHALEVQLPFLQSTLKNFTLVPLIVGECHSGAVFNILESIRPDENDLVVVSSDLSHYQPYPIAKEQDEQSCTLIEHLNSDILTGDDACGFVAINGLIDYAVLHSWHAKCIAYQTSGDSAGDKDKVVGYGAFHFGKKSFKLSS